MGNVWFRRYKERRKEAEKLRTKHRLRCEELGGLDPIANPGKHGRFVAKAVHESNWQEGIWVEEQRAIQIATAAIEPQPLHQGPRINFAEVLDTFLVRACDLLLEGATAEYIATHNLSTCHMLIRMIGEEMLNKEMALCVDRLLYESSRPELADDLESERMVSDALAKIMHHTPSPPYMTRPYNTKYDMIRQMLADDRSCLYPIFEVRYLTYLHCVLFSGILTSGKQGAIRTEPVRVGNPDIRFAKAEDIEEQLNAFCKSVPTFAELTYNDASAKDPVLEAALLSFRFGKIHPFEDGNGRISRLLMNLVLNMAGMPPVYIRADSSGSKKYYEALKRADRNGDPEPLGTLICMSLIDIYEEALRTM